MDLSEDTIRRHLPYYLTEPQQQGLLKALRELPSTRHFYARIDDPEPLQGDVWTGFQVFNFDDGARARIRGLVVSNSCDLADANHSLLPAKIMFVPIVDLEHYREALETGGIAADRVMQHLADVRAQRITTLFYLPAGQALGREHVALLFDSHSMPLKAFAGSEEASRIVSLNNTGFYVFILKLSVHLCRILENVDRTKDEVAADPGCGLY